MRAFIYSAPLQIHVWYVIYSLPANRKDLKKSTYASKKNVFLCFTSEQSEQEENRCAKGLETSSKLFAGKS